MRRNLEIERLTPQQIAELDVYAAQAKLLTISNMLIDIDREMFVAVQELGNARVRVEQLKNSKSTLIEISRALGKVIQSG